ncbi:MAG: 30S ribosomal protein S6 [Dehalococcoidales bacterium]
MAKKRVIQKKTDSKLQEYELVYIVSPEVAEDALEARIDSISQFITGKEGVIDGVDKWGKKRLAYPIKRFLDGNYVLTKFKMGPARCKELDASLRMSEEIIRHLLIKVGG